MVAVFVDPEVAEHAVDELHDAGVGVDAIEERRSVDTRRSGILRGWLAGGAVGTLTGLAIGAFLSWVAALPWVVTMVGCAVAGTAVGLVVGGAFGSLLVSQEARDGARHSGATAAPTTVGVSTDSPAMLSVARRILRRHRPVRVTIRQ